MKGRIITIEGSDGAGKETQKNLLVKNLKSQGYKVKTLSFPDYSTFFGAVTKEYLNGNFGQLADIHPKLSSLPYSLDRSQYKELILTWLRNGGNWIFDRYMESNWGHQASRLNGNDRINLIKWLEEAETTHLGLPPSDLVAYLDLPVEWSQKAMEKEARKKDLHESNLEYQLRVQETYRSIASIRDNWSIIDCLKANYRELPREQQRLTIEEVNERLMQIVLPILDKSPINFYFATSIVGLKGDSDINKYIVEFLKTKGHVFTEHIVRDDIFEFEKKQIKKGVNIYNRDMNWLENSGYMIVEASGSSFGVGREIERAVLIGLPVLVLHKHGLRMSRMLTHDSHLTIQSYQTKDDMERIIEKFLHDN